MKMRNTQQKFGKSITPTSAPQACSSVVLSLKDRKRSVSKTQQPFVNTLDVDQPQHTGGSKTKVYVQNKNGKPLMPCTPRKAKNLLKQGRAEVVKQTPFAIRLLWDCEHNTQDVTLGIDAGYTNIGFSATTNTKELISGEVILRKDVSKKLQDRAMYRQHKRNRLWHRKPRFNNRIKPEGWLAPSIQHKLNTHKKIIEQIKNLSPITKTIIEIAAFDQQKMQNPEISGEEYQYGELHGTHIKEYLLEKFKRTCAYCNKKDVPLEVEHIIPKSRGGTNRTSNLTIACTPCNRKKGNQTAEEYGFPKIQAEAKKTLKSAAFMNIVRKRLAQETESEETYGYITKHKRKQNGLPKSHINDAYIIAGGTNQERCKTYTVTQTRRNNRCLQKNRKGFAPSIRRKRYEIQPNDTILFKGKKYKTKGTLNKGARTYLDNGKTVLTKKVQILHYGKGLHYETKNE